MDSSAALCSPPKKALITGVTGQDGSYLAELLISKGYEVHGVLRRASGGNMERLHTRTEAASNSFHQTPLQLPLTSITNR